MVCFALLWRLVNKIWKYFACMVVLCVKLQIQRKNCGNECKNSTRSKFLIFSMYISKKLTFWNYGKKSKNKKELLSNVKYNYQMSKGPWNFARLLNFHRPSLAYEISKNFLTSPNEHTVCWDIRSQDPVEGSLFEEGWLNFFPSFFASMWK